MLFIAKCFPGESTSVQNKYLLKVDTSLPAKQFIVDVASYQPMGKCNYTK